MTGRQTFSDILAAFSADEDGATAIEYGLIVALLAMAIVASVSSIGDRLETSFTGLDTELGVHLDAEGD